MVQCQPSLLQVLSLMQELIIQEKDPEQAHYPQIKMILSSLQRQYNRRIIKFTTYAIKIIWKGISSQAG